MIVVIPTVFSSLLLSAHFLRDGQLILVGFSLLLPMLLIGRRRTTLSILQGALVLGTIEWLRTMVSMVQIRLAMDEPWLRLAVILVSVASFTLATAWWLRRWPVVEEDGGGGGD